MGIFGGFRFDRAKKILIVRTDRIGDVVLTLPMATAIRRRFPESEVHFLLRGYTAPLATDHRDVGKVVVSPDSLKDRAAYDRCLREIRSEKYDLAIVVHSKGDVARLVWDAKIPFRMGSGLRLHSWRYNVPVFQRRRRPKQHELDYNLDMIREYVPVPHARRWISVCGPMSGRFRAFADSSTRGRSNVTPSSIPAAAEAQWTFRWRLSES